MAHQVAPLCSVIIPVLNERAQVVRQVAHIRSLIANESAEQGLESSIEVIFVDGGSQDGTLEKLESLGQRVLSTRRGRAVQMNTGAGVARGQLLFFLHVDTLLPLNFLQIVRQLVCSQATWGFFCVRMTGRHWLLRLTAWLMGRRSTLTHVATGDQCLFVRADIWQREGGFAAMPLMEDVEFSKRLRLLAKPMVVRTPVITSSRRWEQNGIVKTILLMWSLRLGYWLGASPDRLALWYR